MAEMSKMGPGLIRPAHSMAMVALFVGIVWALRHVPLPGLDWNYIESMIEAAGGNVSWRPTYSVVSLGIGPYLTSAFLCQLVSSLIPPRGSSRMREVTTARLDHFVLGGMILVALYNSYSGSSYMMRVALPPASRPVVPHPGIGSMLAIMGAEAAGAALLVFLARALTRFARVNGIAILAVWEISEQILRVVTKLSPRDKANTGYVALLAVGACLAGVLLRRRRSAPLRDATDGGYAPVLRLPLGAAGGTPLVLATWFMNRLLSASRMAGWRTLEALARIGKPSGLTTVAVMSGGFALVWAVLFDMPRRVAEALRSSRLLLPGARPGSDTEARVGALWVKPTLVGVLIMIGLAAVPIVSTWFSLPVGPVFVQGASLLYIVAVGFDVWTSLRAVSTHALAGRTPATETMPVSAPAAGPSGRCPSCAAEVVDDFAVCWSCGGPVTPVMEPPQLPPLPEPTPLDGTPTTVARLSFPIDAEMARLKLEADGIPVLLLDQHLVMANWFLALALGGIKVQVPHECAERARAILFPKEEEPPVAA